MSNKFHLYDLEKLEKKQQILIKIIKEKKLLFIVMVVMEYHALI